MQHLDLIYPCLIQKQSFPIIFSKKKANVKKDSFGSVQSKNEYLAEPINVLISRKNTLQKRGYRESRQKKLNF